MRIKSFREMCGAAVRAARVLLLAAVVPLVAPGLAQAHTASLSWTASTDSVSGYFIYRLAGACPASGTSGFTKLNAAAVTSTAYTDSTIAVGAYCYYATSVLNGAESLPSNFTSAVILPAAPTALSVTGTN